MIRSTSGGSKTELKYVLLMLLFLLMVFWKPLFTSQYSMLAGSDNAFQSYPWLNFLARSLHEGSFPFWNNFDEAGRSFVGEIQTGAFHPLNLLMAVFPLNSRDQLPRTLIEGFLVLHCFLAAFFMFKLARHFQLSPFSALVAGLTFACSGSVAMRSTAQLNLFMASVWIPAVFLFFFKALAAEKWPRRLVFANLAGLFLALCLLGGHHQPFFYTAMALGFTMLLMMAPSSKLAVRLVPVQASRRRAVLVTAAVLVFSICYSSFQLLPALEYAQHVQRSLGTISMAATAKPPYSVVSEVNNMGPGGFLAAVFPFLYDVENRPYMGLLPLLFLGLSFPLFRKSKVVGWAWTLGVFFMLLAMGKWSPLHGLAYLLVPGFGSAREASRILLVCHLAFSLLAGFGALAFFRPIRKKERKEKRRVLQLLFLFWIIVVFAVFAGYFYRLQVLYQPASFDLAFFVCVLLTAVLLLAASRYFGLLPPAGLKIMVFLILLFDFHQSMTGLIMPKKGFDRKQNFEPRQLYAPDGIVNYLQSRAKPFRVDFRQPTYPRNSGEIFRLETVHGFSATRLNTYGDFLDSGYEPHSTHADLLNVKYFISSENLPLPVAFQKDGVRVYENTDCMPRAWLVSRIIAKSSQADVFRALSQNPPKPDREAYVYLSDPLPSPWRRLTTEPIQSLAEARNPRVEYQRLGPNRFKISLQAPQASLLIVSENWYPGWEARSGGKSMKIFQTDGTLMGVLVPEGFSEIVFRYRPTGFKAAIGLTFSGLGFLLVGWVFSARERRRTSDSQVPPGFAARQ